MRLKKIFIGPFIFIITIIVFFLMFSLVINIKYPTMKIDKEEYFSEHAEGLFMGCNNISRLKLNQKYIWLVGDSFTGGGGVNAQTEAPPVYLQKIIDKNNDEYQVINFGMSDSTPLEQFYSFKEHYEKAYPDIVIHIVSSNDFSVSYYHFDPITYCDMDIPWYYNMLNTLGKDSSTLRYLTDRVFVLHERITKGATGRPYWNVVGISEYFGNYSFECIIQTIDAFENYSLQRNITHIIAYIPANIPWEQHNGNWRVNIEKLHNYEKSALRLEEREHSLDFLYLFVNWTDKDALYSKEDGYHYSPLGNQVIAQRIYDHLVENKII